MLFRSAYETADLNETSLQISLKVAQAYADLLASYWRMQSTEQSLAVHQKLRAQVQRRVDLGAQSDADLQLAQTRLDSIKAELSAIRARVESNEVRLKQLIGKPIKVDELLSSLSKPVTIKVTQESALDAALALNPSIQKARAQSRIQDAIVEEGGADGADGGVVEGLGEIDACDLRADAAGRPLKARFAHGYEYSDCWVEDSRLVVLNARDAANRGAEIRTRTKFISARRSEGLWEIVTQDDGRRRDTHQARALVNAAGPWVSEALGTVEGFQSTDRIRLVKGSHIVVDALFDHDRCYIFQNADGRICFAIPYEQDFTLIGTTDEDYTGDIGKPQISEAETDYLLAAVSEYFRRPVKRADVRWSYSGIRPLYDDGASKAQEATRDYVLRLDAGEGRAPLLSVFGGKITTYRRLAEHALRDLAPYYPQMGLPWTATRAVDGGEFADAPTYEAAFDNFVDGAAMAKKDLPKELIRILVRRHGVGIDELLEDIRTVADLGRHFGGHL